MGGHHFVSSTTSTCDRPTGKNPLARQDIAEHFFRSSALQCTATARSLIPDRVLCDSLTGGRPAQHAYIVNAAGSQIGSVSVLYDSAVAATAEGEGKRATNGAEGAGDPARKGSAEWMPASLTTGWFFQALPSYVDIGGEGPFLPEERSLLDGLAEQLSGFVQQLEADKLLTSMLPRTVALQLLEGRQVEARKFDSVTILFTDIVSFTNISASSTPQQVMSMLNRLYFAFDSIVANMGVYKVETIGDAYMCVAGLPEPMAGGGRVHAETIVRTALAFVDATENFPIRVDGGDGPENMLRIRVGIHSGPVVAGVVGRKMPRYCLFGDTVNVASRMESNGVPRRVHMSSATHACLVSGDEPIAFEIEDRGVIPIKGKGSMQTYFANANKAV